MIYGRSITPDLSRQTKRGTAGYCLTEPKRGAGIFRLSGFHRRPIEGRIMAAVYFDSEFAVSRYGSAALSETRLS